MNTSFRGGPFSVFSGPESDSYSFFPLYLQTTIEDKLISWDHMAVTMERTCKKPKDTKKQKQSRPKRLQTVECFVNFK